MSKYHLPNISVVTLKDYSLQQVFNHVVYHLLMQNKKSTYDKKNSRCRYRGADNCKCAAGWVISDEEYRVTMEGVNFETVCEKHIQCVSYDHIGLLTSLQMIHDHVSVVNWPTSLNRLATGYALNTQVITDTIQERDNNEQTK